MTRRTLLGAGLATAAATLTGEVQAQEKPLVERMGYKATDKVLLLHADDLGMCHSVNAASTKAMTEGIVSTASVMVPCPWFPEMANWSKEHPEADLGLHLTLTSEWKVYRWRPVAPISEVPSLLDDEGYLPRGVAEVVLKAKPEHVERELRAQIERARKFGMKPTHVDSHMGTLFASKPFFDIYLKVARETNLVPMVPGPTPDILAQARGLGLDYIKVTAELSRQGYPVLDLLNTSLKDPTYEGRKAEFRRFLKELKPGVTELIVHISGDDQEIQHVTGNWRNRYHELKLTTDPEVISWVKEEGVKLAGYRKLNELFNAGRG